jgi:6-phosphogluconate dehydrogenase (decarboxylating)
VNEVLVFQHDPFEDLGFFAEVLEKLGADYRVVRLFHGEMPEEELRNVDSLIVLGGPMGVDEEDSFPFLRWEKRIIRAAIDESVPAPVLSAALFGRFASRGESEFADKVMSAMRFEFGGHAERSHDE